MNLSCDSASWDDTLTSKWFFYALSPLFFGFFLVFSVFLVSSASLSDSEPDSTAIVNFGLESLAWSLSSES